jgi:transposase
MLGPESGGADSSPFACLGKEFGKRWVKRIGRTGRDDTPPFVGFSTPRYAGLKKEKQNPLYA